MFYVGVHPIDRRHWGGNVERRFGRLDANEISTIATNIQPPHTSKGVLGSDGGSGASIAP
jgi:hypothetical protein